VGNPYLAGLGKGCRSPDKKRLWIELSLLLQSGQGASCGYSSCSLLSTSLSAAVRASGALTLKSGSTPVSCARVNQIGNLETCRYEPVVEFGPSAQTQLTFNFSFSGAGISGSGTLAATLVSGNEFLVTSISGTQNGCGRDLTMAAHDCYRANRVGLTPSEPDIPN